MSPPSAPLRFETFELDEANARLTGGGQPIELAPRAFAVLAHLARRPGRLVTKVDLLDAVWGHRHVSESVLKTTVSQVRAALADDAREPRYIETVSRRGYRFIALPREDAPGSQATASMPRLEPATVLVGREASLSLLQERWSAALEGRAQVVWVTGEAGVGKTMLLDGFITALPDAACARGQCIEQVGAAEPYLPILEALGMLCRGDPTLVPVMRAVAPTWLSQLPWLLADADREAVQREAAASSQARMLREFTELIDRYTHRQPLLLVIEDLHWSDHATVQLVDHLARRRGTGRLMLLASFRPAELIAQEHPLKRVRHELRLHRLCTEIALSPFSEAEVAEYVRMRLPLEGPAESLVRRLHAHTDGLPLFVASVVEDLLARGATGDAVEANWSVPHSLAGVIEQQIERLPVELRGILEAASVVGLEFRSRIVAHALDRDPAWVRERCEGLVRNQYWLVEAEIGSLPDGSLDARFAFRHTLYRTVFHQRTGQSRRAHLHRAVGRALEAARAEGVPTPSAELGRHAELGHDAAAALRHYARAAGEAMALYAPHEAAGLTDHALRVLPACPAGRQRDELELSVVAQRGVAFAQTRGAAAPEAIAAYERARELFDLLPPSRERAWVLNGLGWVHYSRGDYPSADALAARILDLAEAQEDPLLRVCGLNLRGVVHVYLGRLESGVEHLRRGVALCEEIGDDRLGAYGFMIDPHVSMTVNQVLPLVELGRTAEARRAVRESMVRAAAIGGPINRMLALWGSALLHQRVRDFPRMRDDAAELARVVQEAGLAQGEGPGRWLPGIAEAHLGDPRRAHAMIHEGHGFHARLQMYAGATHVLLGAAEALLLAGDTEAAQREIDEAVALARRIDERVGLPPLLLLRAAILRRRGRHEECVADLRASLAVSRSQHAAFTELAALVALRESGELTPEEQGNLDRLRARIGEA